VPARNGASRTAVATLIEYQRGEHDKRSDTHCRRELNRRSAAEKEAGVLTQLGRHRAWSEYPNQPAQAQRAARFLLASGGVAMGKVLGKSPARAEYQRRNGRIRNVEFRGNLSVGKPNDLVKEKSSQLTLGKVLEH
jgi:hypothetical protein